MNLDLYELLNKIKQQPSLYLGKRSLSHLHVFLDGYTFACRQLGIPLTEQKKKFEKFQEWIEIRFNQESTQSWSRIILFYSEDETATLNRFFELFEEFLSIHDGSKNSNEANKWEQLQAVTGESNLVNSDY